MRTTEWNRLAWSLNARRAGSTSTSVTVVIEVMPTVPFFAERMGRRRTVKKLSRDTKKLLRERKHEQGVSQRTVKKRIHKPGRIPHLQLKFLSLANLLTGLFFQRLKK